MNKVNDTVLSDSQEFDATIIDSIDTAIKKSIDKRNRSRTGDRYLDVMSI